jgi:hypothetical protein
MEEGEMLVPSLWFLVVSLQAYNIFVFLLLFMADWGLVALTGLGDFVITRNVLSSDYNEWNLAQGQPSFGVWRKAKYFKSICFFVIVFKL